MNKVKENINHKKKIISKTKDEVNNNIIPINNDDIQKTENNENNKNIQNNYNEDNKNNTNLSEKEKINNKEEKYNEDNDDDDDEEDKKYFEFNAHFKYHELVEALNALQSKKNESTSNTSNANINNNINNKNSIKKSKQANKINNNCVLTKNKSNNPNKGVSRNVQMNNYIQYLEYIEENKENNGILTSITNNIQPNKTSFLPQTELLKKKINFHLQKLNEIKNQKKDKISVSKEKKKISKININNKEKKQNKSTFNQKFNNLITISLINHNHNIKKNCKNNNESKNNSKKNNIKNNNLINKKIKKSLIKMKNSSKKRINTLNDITTKPLNKVNNEENINQLKISTYILNHIGNKYIKNSKQHFKNIFAKNFFNFNFISEKRKAHSSSLSKSKKHNTTNKNLNIHKNPIIFTNNTNNTNNINEMSKKQNTLNNIISSANRVKQTGSKNFKKKNINLDCEINNKNSSKVKIITLNNINAWNAKNKLNKKCINSIWTSLNNTKNINKTNKTKSKSTSKSNSKSKNKNSYGKLLTENIKTNKNNLCNKRIGPIQKEKTYIIKNIGKLNENINEKKYNKNMNSLSKNLIKNKTNSNNYNSFQNNEENSNITDSQINLNKKRGINIVFKGKNENKLYNNNTNINNLLYKINRTSKNKFINSNSNNSNLTSEKNSKLLCNVSSNIHGAIKKNNIVNNPKGNILKNSKNISKISINNNNGNISISSKKHIDLKKKRKIINDYKK